MKKLIYLLCALPLIFGTACSDDDKKVPDATITASFSGVYVVPGDDVIYVIEGNPVVVESVKVESNDKEEVAIGPVTYIWNGFDVVFALRASLYVEQKIAHPIVIGLQQLHIIVLHQKSDHRHLPCLLSYHVIRWHATVTKNSLRSADTESK